ncbi:MAG: PAS domain S-box protein [Methylobacter sp.]
MKYRSCFRSSIDLSTLLIEIASRNVIHFNPDANVSEAALSMAEKRISSIVVSDREGKLLGIVTERDMLRAMQSKRPPETALGEIMSYPVITVPASITCLDAYQVCQREGVRHLVIANEGEGILGVVSETDFYQHIKLAALAGRRQVASVMTRFRFSLPPEASLQEALNQMQAHQATCVVVLEAERPIGIVTERDIVRLYSRSLQQTTVPVREVMTSNVQTIAHNSTINEAAERMLAAKIRHLVVVDSTGTVAGVINEHDLTQTWALNMADDKQMLDAAFLHTLVNTIPDMVWLKDVNGVYLACNSRFERFFGAKANDIAGKTDYDFVGAELADSFREHDRKSMKINGPSVNEEWVAYADDGHSELLETFKTPMRDSQGKLIGVLGIARDITRRKRAEQALIESENKLLEQKELLNAVLENSLDAVVLMDSKGVVTRWNGHAEMIFGWNKEEAIGQLIHELIVPPRYREAHVRGMTHFLSTGEGPLLNTRVEIFALHRDGSEFPVELSISPIHTTKGYEFSAFIRDISERKSMEWQLAESEELFRAVFEQTPTGIELIDPETLRFVEANPAACRMLGYTHDEYLKLRLIDTQVDLNEQMLEASINQLKETDGAAFENRHRCKNGEILDVEINARLLTMPGKRLLVGVWHDVTERKRAEDALRDNEAKYRQLFETAGDGIFIQDETGFIDCNEKGANMYGLSRAEIIGRSAADLAPEKQPDGRLSAEVAGEMVAAALSGKPQQFEWRPLNAMGVLLDVEITLNRIELGRSVCLQAVVRDITERKRAELALRESEDKLRSLYTLAPLGIALTDMNGRYLEFNESFRRICGYSEDELKSLDYWALTPRKYEADERLQLESLASNGRYGPYEKEYINKDGSLVPLRLNGVVVTGRDGQKYIWSIVEDITESKRAEENLALREREFRTLAENSPDNIARYDYEGRCLYMNPALERTLGLSAADIMGKLPWTVIGDRYDEYNKAVLHVGATGESICFELKIPARNGQAHTHSIRMVAEMGPDGTPAGVLAVGRDITEIKLAEENLRITASVFDNTQEAILITDANNAILDVNPAFTHITGYSREEVLGKNPRLLSSGRQDKLFYAEMWQSLQNNKAWRGEVWNRRKSGEVYAELLSISVICSDNGEVMRHVGVFSDISYIKEHEAELSRVAHYDVLTGLPNRVLLADRMKQALAHATREQSMVAVCYLDLDGFKAINDNMGHEAGDQVLIDVARRIENTIRGGDTVARLGGDEFVVLLSLKPGEKCVSTLERLLAVIAQPIMIKGLSNTVGVSIGVSIYPMYGEDADTLLRHADQAMYTAKQSGKNRFCIYDADQEQRVRSHHEFLNSIRHGLEHNQFEMHYQPKINLSTKQLVGAEALIRWRHPERGLLSPIEFLHPIETTELGIEMGNWVIASVLAQIKRWRDAGLEIEVSINISPYHLESSGFAKNLRQQLNDYPDIPLGTLQIEVLETVALNDITKVRNIIEECRRFGVGFALDDFGAGYSSLSYLSKLPIDVIKIDQSFVRDMLEDNGDKTIVQGIIALAKAFDLKVVAEGIETVEQYQVLHDMGCEIGQGYGIARPMAAAKLSDWKP